jgi:endonuclease/exonuclease/phosphatase family metal-dependent hydrolase
LIVHNFQGYSAIYAHRIAKILCGCLGCLFVCVWGLEARSEWSSQTTVAKTQLSEQWIGLLRDDSAEGRERLLRELRTAALEQKHVLLLLTQAFEHLEPEVRSGVAYALGQTENIDTQLSVNLLLRGLRDRHWKVRMNASYGLRHRKIKQPEVIEALIDSLGDRAWQVKANAAAALKHIGRIAHPALSRATQHRSTIVRALAQQILHSKAQKASDVRRPKRKQHRVWPTNRRKIRLLSYNICHGMGLDGVVDLKRIADMMRHAHADIIALQEVDRLTQRGFGVDQAQYMGKALGMRHIFAQALPFDGGQYGVALLSRFAIRHQTIHQLLVRPREEPRVVLEVRLIVPLDNGRNAELVVMNTHFPDRSTHSRQRAAKQINQWMRASKDSVILLGDLNEQPSDPTIRILQRYWHSATYGHHSKGFPSAFPVFQFDYVFYRPRSHWRVNEARVMKDHPARVASDHLPLLVELEWAYPTANK